VVGEDSTSQAYRVARWSDAARMVRKGRAAKRARNVAVGRGLAKVGASADRAKRILVGSSPGTVRGRRQSPSVTVARSIQRANRDHAVNCSNASCSVNDIPKRAGIAAHEQITPHTLRHAFGGPHRQATAGLRLAALMGHTSIETTAHTYVDRVGLDELATRVVSFRYRDGTAACRRHQGRNPSRGCQATRHRIGSRQRDRRTASRTVLPWALRCAMTARQDRSTVADPDRSSMTTGGRAGSQPGRA